MCVGRYQARMLVWQRQRWGACQRAIAAMINELEQDSSFTGASLASDVSLLSACCVAW